MATADERDALAEQLEAAQQAGTDLATEVQAPRSPLAVADT